MEQLKYGEDYKKDFHPEAYLQMYYSTVDGASSEGDMMEVSMRFWHEAFAQGRITGRRLLDIGTGPTIHSVISASRYCDSIYLSDFAPQNREVLRKWREGSLEHSFKCFFQYVVDREGKGFCPLWSNIPQLETMEQLKYGEDYRKDFQPEAYLQMYYSTVDGASSEGEMLEVSMRFWHEAFAQGRMTGRRLLDIGTGPTIHSVISASRYCDSIYLSDFAPQNREVLRKWLEGSLEHSFKSFFQYVVDKEGKGELPNDREAMLKDKIVGIFPLDLQQTDPLMPSLFPPFDIITSSLCLEAAAQDLAGYEIVVRHMGRLLKDGGHVVLFGVLGESFYLVGSHSFSCAKISAEQVKDVWKRSAFTIVEWKQKAHTRPDVSLSDFEGAFLMVAQKSV